MKGKVQNYIIRLILIGCGFHPTQSAFSQQANCPAGWSQIGVVGNPLNPPACKANLPSSDFYFLTPSIGTNRSYPVCGGSSSNGFRIPVLPSFEPLPISASFFPNSTREYENGGSTYHNSVKYTRGIYNSTGSIIDDPAYMYDALTRCVCSDPKGTASARYTNGSATDIGVDPYTTGNVLSNNAPRIYPDTYETISSQDQNATRRYNMVAYGSNPTGSNPTVDGRLGNTFKTSNSATCGCPNINEYPVLSSTGTETGIVGYYCAPKITTTLTGGRVLTTYDSTRLLADVINHDDDRPGTTGNAVARILVPNINGESVEYARKIWTCAEPWKLSANGTSSTCIAPALSEHQCNENNANGGLTDPLNSVGKGPTGLDVTLGTILNKKLACCLNETSSQGFTSGIRMKYDCVDNSTTNYTTFDQLWASVDDASRGGQPNALMLSGPLNQPITGWYTLDGNRCDQFNEFGGPVVPKRLSKNSAGAWVETASALPAPTAPPAVMTNLLQNTSWSGSVQIPTLVADKARCPILVRAAMIATCPVNASLPVVQKTYNFSGTNHCTAAASVQIHVRIEQVFEIQGVPTMKPIDTIQDRRLASSINVEKILNDKNGNNCPRGASRQGNACVYQ